MNERIRKQIAVNNPFVFKHISNLKGIDHFDDVGPCVILASPGNVFFVFFYVYQVKLPLKLHKSALGRIDEKII